MTKKDYVLIASVIRGCGDKYEVLTAIQMLKEVAYQLATYLEQDNPKFDKRKFIEATGF